MKKTQQIAVALVLICLAYSGCVRVAGTAGYWHQGPEDEEPQGKQVTLDSQKLVPSNSDKTQGSIEY